MSEERTAQEAAHKATQEVGQEVGQEAVWQAWLARWAAEASIQPWVEAREEAAPGELLAVSAACAPLARLLARRPQAREGWVRAVRARIAAAQAQQPPPRARIVAFVEAGGISTPSSPPIAPVGPDTTNPRQGLKTFVRDFCHSDMDFSPDIINPRQGLKTHRGPVL